MDRTSLPTIRFHVGGGDIAVEDTQNLITPTTPTDHQGFLSPITTTSGDSFGVSKKPKQSLRFNPACEVNELNDDVKPFKWRNGTGEMSFQPVETGKSCQRKKGSKKVAEDQRHARRNGFSAEGTSSTFRDMQEKHPQAEDNAEEKPLTSGDQDGEKKRKGSLKGDCDTAEQEDATSQHEHRLADYFAGMLVASENKLTMKLFGSRSALLKEKQRQLVTHTCIIHPCSNFRLYWDLLMLAFLVTNLIVLPVSIAFFFNDMGSPWMIFNIICDSLFMIDIVINFRTGLIDPKAHGEVILDGKAIAIHYLKGWFVIDMFSSLPIDYLFLSYEGYSYTAGRAIRILRLAKLLQLLRLLRISRLVRYIRIWQEYFSMATVAVRIFNLICVMVLLSHWNGCIQFFVPVIQGWPEDSWISREKLQNVGWWEQYTNSLFKALSHMLSIGYGMYPPENHTEMWLTIASMLAGATCYALFVGHATALIQSFDTSSRQYRDHLQQVNEYMSYRKLPTDLRRKITDYYDHKHGGKMFNEQSILDELSHTLRTAILKHNCQHLIQNVPFFEKEKDKGNFVDDVLTRLSFEMAMPDDIIVKANTKADRMYFIQEGVVKILADDGSVVTRLSDGSYFGEVGLLSGQTRVADVMAETYCNLFSLSKEDFDHILELHPVMRKTIETIAAKRVHTLGKDPAMVSSRESLLEDVTGIHHMMEENNSETASQDELVGDETTNKQFLSVFKSFFTSDSEQFSKTVQRTRQNSRSSSPKPTKENMAMGPIGLSQLVMVPGAPRRASSAVQLTTLQPDNHAKAEESVAVDDNSNELSAYAESYTRGFQPIGRQPSVDVVIHLPDNDEEAAEAGSSRTTSPIDPVTTI